MCVLLPVPPGDAFGICPHPWATTSRRFASLVRKKERKEYTGKRKKERNIPVRRKVRNIPVRKKHR
jgi:hypothetical protein